jgi:hypothetical protein
VTLDSRSFAAQIRGGAGTPREWVYVELNGRSYARDARFKLTNKGGLFDLTKAPFEEVPVPADSTDPAAVAARSRLQKVLDEHPAAPGVPQPKKAAKKGGKKGGKKARQPDADSPATSPS